MRDSPFIVVSVSDRGPGNGRFPALHDSFPPLRDQSAGDEYADGQEMVTPAFGNVGNATMNPLLRRGNSPLLVSMTPADRTRGIADLVYHKLDFAMTGLKGVEFCKHFFRLATVGEYDDRPDKNRETYCETLI